MDDPSTIADRATDERGRPATPNRSARGTSREPTRRRLLAAGVGGVAVLLAGCSGASEPDGGTATPTPAATTERPTATGTPTPAPVAEVDVVGVKTRHDGGDVLFDVTLRPSAESGGADWWQLERPDGERLLRRPFDPPRTDERFSTFERFAPPDDISAVVVRAHAVEGGYGGLAMVVDLDAGDISLLEQGADPDDPTAGR